MSSEDDLAQLRTRITDFLATYNPQTMPPEEFLRARFDAGLAWIHYPEGLGGLGLEQSLQSEVDQAFAEADAPTNHPERNLIGLGIAAPTILRFGTPEQKERYLRPLWTGEEIWCQLFSEPGAGSDLANVATRAVPDGDDWIVNGQKVWSSFAHTSQFGILVTRTNPELPKHAGITYFICDMSAPGIEVRPLRQITGEAEFNEVFLSDVRLSDSLRLGEVGQGWKVVAGTLDNERVAVGKPSGRGAGMIGVVSQTWRDQPMNRTADLYDKLLKLWVDAEVFRLSGVRLGQKLAQGQPGPEGSTMKLNFARIAQQLAALEVEMVGEDGLRYESDDAWALVRSSVTDFTGRDPGYRYLRAKGNSIEGGTSEILKNIVAERVLGLPREHRVDKDQPWKELAK